jgi:hypothetical protein
MNIQPKIRNAALVAALAAAAVTAAWAANEAKEEAVPPVTSAQAPAATAPEAVPVTDTLAPNESVVTTTDTVAAPITSEPRVAPVVDRSVEQPKITVEQQRLSEDERIQAQVMDRIAAMQNVSGKIAVQSANSIVTLSGYTVTSGQAYRAGREAGRVIGVKYVQNEIRPRIGGSI